MRNQNPFVALGVFCAASACGTRNTDDDDHFGGANGSTSGGKAANAWGTGGSYWGIVGGNGNVGGNANVGGHANAGTGSNGTIGGNGATGGNNNSTGGAYNPDDCTQLSGAQMPAVLESSYEGLGVVRNQQ